MGKKLGSEFSPLMLLHKIAVDFSDLISLYTFSAIFVSNASLHFPSYFIA